MADTHNKGSTGGSTGNTGGAGSTAGRSDTGGMVDKAKDTVQHLADRAGDYAGQAREKVAEWAGDAGDSAKQAGRKVQEWAGDAYDYASDHVGDFGKDMTAMIRRNPIPAVLIGFGLGLLLGRSAKII